MNIKRLAEKSTWVNLGESMKYVFYIMTHPFDGSWDLIHEKRGSLAAANVFVGLFVLVQILTVTTTNSQFMILNPEYYNAFFNALSILLPILLWTVANWSLTTLLDGKGKLRHIYMGTAYAFVPMIIINIILIVLSHVLTFQEGVIYGMLSGFGMVYSVFLLIASMMMIHDYGFLKTILSSLLTIVVIGIILFLFLMFLSLFSDGLMYFVSIYKEIAFRVH